MSIISDLHFCLSRLVTVSLEACELKSMTCCVAMLNHMVKFKGLNE